jgi:hypothetical protein
VSKKRFSFVFFSQATGRKREKLRRRSCGVYKNGASVSFRNLWRFKFNLVIINRSRIKLKNLWFFFQCVCNGERKCRLKALCVDALCVCVCDSPNCFGQRTRGDLQLVLFFLVEKRTIYFFIWAHAASTLYYIPKRERECVCVCVCKKAVCREVN